VFVVPANYPLVNDKGETVATDSYKRDSSEPTRVYKVGDPLPRREADYACTGTGKVEPVGSGGGSGGSDIGGYPNKESVTTLALQRVNQMVNLGTAPSMVGAHPLAVAAHIILQYIKDEEALIAARQKLVLTYPPEFGINIAQGRDEWKPSLVPPKPVIRTMEEMRKIDPLWVAKAKAMAQACTGGCEMESSVVDEPFVVDIRVSEDTWSKYKAEQQEKEAKEHCVQSSGQLPDFDAVIKGLVGLPYDSSPDLKNPLVKEEQPKVEPVTPSNNLPRGGWF
jgi:hypothetical protein